MSLMFADHQGCICSNVSTTPKFLGGSCIHPAWLVQGENKSSELVGKLEFKDDIMHDLGSDFYFIPVRFLPSKIPPS